METTLTIDDYRYALKAFAIYYSTAEKTICVTVQDNVPNAPVCDWLANDLEKTGGDLSIPIPPQDLPLIDTMSKLMGYLYVKQGSCLGGQIMSKNLQKTLGLKPIIDQKFFAAYGSKTGAKWQEFTKHLQKMEDQLNLDEAMTSAAHAFNLIQTICNQVWKARNVDTP